MKFGSLFAGIGGIDLGLEWAGMKCAWQVEIDEFCLESLNKHWPNIPKFGDIRQIKSLPHVDLIAAGFPCPAFSVMGKSGGFAQDDLFFEIVRLVDEIKPTWIVLENVAGFVRWREEANVAIKSVGYEYIDFILDARDFGIPQSRKRWFGVCVQTGVLPSTQLLQRFQRTRATDLHGIQSYIENAQRWGASTISSKEEWRIICANARRMRIDNGIPNRVDRLRSLGNAVVPQVAEWIGRRIMEHEKLLS